MIDTYLAVSWQSQFFSIHQTRPSVCSSLVTIQQRVPAAHCRGKYISFPHQTQKNRGQKLLCGGVKFSAIVRRRYGTPHTSVTSANTMFLDAKSGNESRSGMNLGLWAQISCKIWVLGSREESLGVKSLNSFKPKIFWQISG